MKVGDLVRYAYKFHGVVCGRDTGDTTDVGTQLYVGERGLVIAVDESKIASIQTFDPPVVTRWAMSHARNHWKVEEQTDE